MPPFAVFANGGFCFKEKIMLELKNINITLEPSGRKIIENLNYVLQSGVKCAVIGEEGDGKSTFLKYIYDKKSVESYCNASGQVVKHGAVAYLPQFLEAEFFNMPVLEYLADGDVYANFKLAEKMRIPAELLYDTRAMATLSGGERVKVRLFKLLCARPDVLLLDEPTNDLDIQTLEWLEDFLLQTPSAVLFVSHDIALLSKVAQNVIHIEQLIKKTSCKITVAACGYDEYVQTRSDLLERQTRIANKQREDYAKKEKRWQQIYERVRYEQGTISRRDPAGGRLLKKKMAGVLAQKKRFEREREEFIDIPDSESAIVTRFSPEISLPGGKTVLDFYCKQLSAGGKLLSKDVKLHVHGGEKIVITGSNGAGKSTLLSAIWEELPARKDIKAMYMPQNYGEVLDFSLSPVEFLECRDGEEITRARTFLGKMNFTPNEMTGSTGNLSGGQQAKLLFLKMVLKECNVLILDEPTRNFSPLSAPVVCGALSEFGGSIISVSHDRNYIESVCDTEYVLTENGLIKK